MLSERKMTEVAHSIDLNLPKKLRDKDYRRKFFLAESSAEIAAQLVALRKRRGLNQQQVAESIDTQQPAISRIEKADYQSWSFSILRKIAGKLDARIRVLIEPSEDILGEYEHDDYATSSWLEAASPKIEQAALTTEGFDVLSDPQWVRVLNGIPSAGQDLSIEFHAIASVTDPKKFGQNIPSSTGSAILANTNSIAPFSKDV
jgi:transcriptional regulator with XRE-family HTH domain